MESQVLNAFFAEHPETGAEPVVTPPAPPPVPGVPVPVPGEPAKVPEPPKAGLADLIRQGREERAARAKEAETSKSLQDKVADLESKLSRATKTDVLADPIGWAEAHGLTPEERSLLGQTFLYDLVPDKAPDAFKFKLLEARATRKERLAEEQRAEETRKSRETEAARVEQMYVGALEGLVSDVSEVAKAPYSAAWFGDEHGNWTASLLATARNMAETARAAGSKADLTPAKVAAALEGDIAARFGRAPVRQAPTPAEVPVTAKAAPGAEDTRSSATSVRGLTGGGAPPRPAANEAEALERAKKLLLALP